MAELEKVMKGLECCSAMDGEHCRECPYAKECEEGGFIFWAGTAHLAADALELLKAQEPKKVKYVRRLTKVMKGICPACEMEIESVMHGRLTKFCKFCGQAVKWE